MTQPPLVALTTSLIAAGGSHEQPAVSVYASYLAAVQRVGLVPVLLSPVHSPEAVEALMARCAGVLLTGGDDIDPARYGAAPSPALGAVEPERDELEWRVLDAALARRLPVLGICRGMQVLNVYFGGTLYQDLATERPGSLPHERTEEWGRRSHEVVLSEGSLLHGAVGARRIGVNSYHHQAACDVPSGLRAVATAEDGVIEGIESADHDWVVGVQWHPERQVEGAPETDPDRRLFEAFARVVGARV